MDTAWFFAKFSPMSFTPIRMLSTSGFKSSVSVFQRLARSATLVAADATVQKSQMQFGIGTSVLGSDDEGIAVTKAHGWDRPLARDSYP